jgi:hypothetical protein
MPGERSSAGPNPAGNTSIDGEEGAVSGAELRHVLIRIRSPLAGLAGSLAFMSLPRPRIAAADHLAAHVSNSGRSAPGNGFPTIIISPRHAFQSRAANLDVPGAGRAGGATEDFHQMIPGSDAGRGPTRTPRPTAAIQFPHDNALEADLWSFGAPDRSVPGPDLNRRTNEWRPKRNNGQERHKQHCSMIIDISESPTINWQYIAQAEGLLFCAC